METARPSPTDAKDIYQLIAVRDTALVGKPDCTPDDVDDMLTEPGVDLDSDAWLVREGGRLTGFGRAYRRGSGQHADVEVQALTDTATQWLWDAVTARAGELVGACGDLHAGIFPQDAVSRAAAETRGFAHTTSFHRMRIDHVAPEPAFLPGVTVRRGSPDDDELLRTAHRVREEGMADHYAHTAETFEEWADRVEASSAYDWSQILVAYVHDRPAAVLIGTDHFASDENCGYVMTLAVLPAFRGRGLGKLLLRRAFEADAKRGRVGTILHVDSNNTTPALDLYLSVGMRPILEIQMWRLSLSEGSPSQSEG
ncbi:GNAT family N-acetyltransferase [Streptosporangiaceae bacterium NEAU-GS5]|nr:GNAT family N-acetyltransferase [Streptosporangiaceae bacterium NEAU-GS5]